MKALGLSLVGLLIVSASVVAGEATDPCSLFCIRMASDQQKPEYTIERIYGGKDTVWVGPGVQMGLEIVDRVESVNDPFGAPAILLYFTEDGMAEFHEFSSKLVGARIAVFVGGELLLAPIIRSPVEDDRVLISGDFSEEETEHFVQRLSEQIK